MALIFWMLTVIAAVGSSGWFTYLVNKSDDVEVEQARLWSFSVMLMVFSVMSGFTACMFGNHQF